MMEKVLPHYFPSNNFWFILSTNTSIYILRPGDTFCEEKKKNPQQTLLGFWLEFYLNNNLTRIDTIRDPLKFLKK